MRPLRIAYQRGRRLKNIWRYGVRMAGTDLRRRHDLPLFQH
jgi:hypothetical protein